MADTKPSTKTKADTEEMPDTGRTLRQRLIAIAGDLPAIPATSKNQYGKGAIGIDDVENQLRPLFFKHGVVARWTYDPDRPPAEVRANLWLVVLSVTIENADDPGDSFVDHWSDIGSNPMAARSFAIKGYYKSLFHIAESEEAEEASQPAARATRPANGSAPASGAQTRHIRAILDSVGREEFTLAPGATMADASEIIDGLKADALFDHAKLVRAMAEPSADPSAETPPAQGTAEPERAALPKASPYKPASSNQLATIAKLSRLMGKPEEPREDMTSAEASERITELSRAFNERKGSGR